VLTIVDLLWLFGIMFVAVALRSGLGWLLWVLTMVGIGMVQDEQRRRVPPPRPEPGRPVIHQPAGDEGGDF
jgi:hypothetical protein